MAEANFREQLAHLQARLEGLAQAQIDDWHAERDALYQAAHTRFAEIDRAVSPITGDTETVQRAFYDGLEALRETREAQEHEPLPLESRAAVNAWRYGREEVEDAATIAAGYPSEEDRFQPLEVLWERLEALEQGADARQHQDQGRGY